MNNYPNISGAEKFTEKKVQVKEAAVNYAVSGKGKAIVLVHGWINNWCGFIPLGLCLRKNFRVYILDLPGYGESSELKEYSLEICADYLAGFIDALKIKPAAVIGLSMGSLVTSIFGKKYPEKTENIILLGTIFKNKKNRIVTKFTTGIFEAVNNREKLESAMKKIVASRYYSYSTARLNMHRFDKQLIDNYGNVGREKMNKKAYVQMGLSSFEFRLHEIMHSYPKRTLFLFGKNDRICSISDAKKFLKNVKGDFTFATVEDAGHIVSLEKPKETAEEIKRFIRE